VVSNVQVPLKGAPSPPLSPLFACVLVSHKALQLSLLPGKTLFLTTPPKSSPRMNVQSLRRRIQLTMQVCVFCSNLHPEDQKKAIAKNGSKDIELFLRVLVI